MLMRSNPPLKASAILQGKVMDGFSRAFASTTFEDQDAGSGPVPSGSPSLGPVTTAIHNISARHLHDIGSAVPDERQALRSWRRQLQECMNQQHARMIRFLVTNDVSGADSEVARRCQDVLTKYSKPTWNFASSTRDILISPDITRVMDDISGELGLSVETLRAAQKRAIRAYVQSAAAVCAAETRLEEKLKRLDTIHGRLSDLMFLEPTEELADLTGPVRAYLDSVYERVNLEEDYTALVDGYKRFAVLRGLVSLSHFERPPAPTCTICMTREVTQALTPCGHTFCDECVRNQMTTCYICRVQVRDKLRLYFS
jgi:Zinc finger, C3HC4 type (RING finger)